MKTLTVRQPWAGLIVDGKKRVEWRSWPTSYRGRIAIHAGMGGSGDGPRGAVIGTVELRACVRRNEIDIIGIPGDERDVWGWILEAPERMDPVTARGKLGLWEWGP